HLLATGTASRLPTGTVAWVAVHVATAARATHVAAATTVAIGDGTDAAIDHVVAVAAIAAGIATSGAAPFRRREIHHADRLVAGGTFVHRSWELLQSYIDARISMTAIAGHRARGSHGRAANAAHNGAKKRHSEHASHRVSPPSRRSWRAQEKGPTR